MSDEVAASAGADVPEVDGVLAGALIAQGEAGVRALGLLRDARRVMAGAGMERPWEVAESCLRSVMDALLSLPGAPVTVGLKPAAEGLLDSVDTAALDGQSGAAGERVREAAEVLRTELVKPGRYHQGRARAVIERLTGVTLGAAQETALDVWGAAYGATSGTLHGRPAVEGRAVVLYGELLAAVRELLVPLPARAARVLELAVLQDPGAAEAAELAGWADPRATDYFFRSGPAPVWLDVLQEHAPHLLMPDAGAGGRWPAAPFFEHVAGAAPDAVRTWLAAPAGAGTEAAGRAETVAAAGRYALDALLGLAVRHRDVVGAGQLRAVLAPPAVREGGGPAVGATLRLAARWARTVPRIRRTREWILAVEGLLVGAVEDEHAGHRALLAVVERAVAAEEPGVAEGSAVAEAAVAAAVVDEEELRELIAEETAARLPGHDVAMLLRELACTAYPDGRAGGAHPNITMIRAVLAGLLVRDVELLPVASRPLVYGADLALVHASDPAAYGGPRLARTVLDLAAADADAGVGLAERTRRLARVAAVYGRLHDRLLAAHLAGRPPVRSLPSAGGSGEQDWWDRAFTLVPLLLAGEPAPESARLVDLVLHTCPPEYAAQLDADVRTVLGTPPETALVDEVLPADAAQVEGTVEPLASWLRVWDWSPVLPGEALAGWEPVLDAVRRLKPAGPSDPRTGYVLEPVKTTVSLDEEELAELEPVAAAAALAGAEDAGTDGYAMVVHRLVAAGPAAWTTDVPAVLAALKLPELAAFYLAAAAVLAALKLPELAAFYLAAAAVLAERPGAFPDGALGDAITAALGLRRRLGDTAPVAGADGVSRRPDAVSYADQALFDLLTRAWRTDTTLPDGQEAAALVHLQTLTARLTRPADDTAPTRDSDGSVADSPVADAAGGGKEERAPARLGSDPEVRALGCLLEYAFHRVRATGEMPQTVLDTVADALTSHAGEDAVATAVGVHMPGLHRHAQTFAAAHRRELYGIEPGRPSPAASWLRWGPYDRLLLTALDRAELLAALRAEVPGTAEHLAHALLTDPPLLGDPVALWAELANGADGTGAVSRLLEAIGARTPGAVDGVPLPPAVAGRVGAAVVLWRAALAADLPEGSLIGAGAFADAAIEETEWLELMRASAEHSPLLAEADLVAERAAAHSRVEDAVLLAAQLVAHSGGTWPDEAVRRHARTLLDAAAILPEAERSCAVRRLRDALVNAGDIDAAKA